MVKNIEKEMRSFIADLKQNIKDPEELSFLLNRTEGLFDVIFSEMDKFIKEEEEKLRRIKKKQDFQDQRMDEIDKKMAVLNNNISSIYGDIYDEDIGDFEIICPYCNFEFSTDIDESSAEIVCPECNNVIELDWSGETDDSQSNCDGSCFGCGEHE